MDNHAMPAPLIELTQFSHPQWWWLRRGPPPWLEDSRWWVRVFRASLVLGFMGMAGAWVSVMLARTQLLAILTGLDPGTATLFGPGLGFGLGTLLPLSRWLGRGWIMTLLSLPVAMLSHSCAFLAFFLVLGGERPPAGELEVACFIPGFVAALVVALWMGHPLKKNAWLAGALAMVLGSVGFGLVFLVATGPQWRSTLTSGAQWQSTLASYGPYGFIVSLFGAHCLYGSFQSLTGIGLGARLWWQEAGVRDEDSHHE